MPMPRHGVAGAVIGNRFHLVSGMIQSAGAMALLDPKLATHTASHDILELQFDPSPPTAATSEAAAPSQTGTAASSIAASSVCDGARMRQRLPGPKKLYTRYNVNSPRRPGDAREIRAGDRDHAGVAGPRSPIPGTGGGIPIGSRASRRSCGTHPGSTRRKSSRHSRRSTRADAEAVWNGCQAHPYNPSDPEQFQQWYFLPWHRLMLHQFEGRHSRGAAR